MLATMHSTLVVLKDANFYFLLIQDTIVDPKLKYHPNMFFPSITFLAQSASVYPCSLTYLEVYLKLRLIVPCNLECVWQQPNVHEWAWSWIDSKCSLESIYLDKCSQGTSMLQLGWYLEGLAKSGPITYPHNLLKLFSIGVAKDLHLVIPNLTNNFTIYFPWKMKISSSLY